MEHSPAQVVQYYLIAKGVGLSASSTAKGFRVYRDKEPTKPDEVITVRDTTPVQDGRLHKSGEYVEHPGIQVRIRALTGDDGKAKGRAVVKALQEAKRTLVTVGDRTYRFDAFTLTAGLTPFGQEEQSERQLFSVNGTCTIVQL